MVKTGTKLETSCPSCGTEGPHEVVYVGRKIYHLLCGTCKTMNVFVSEEPEETHKGDQELRIVHQDYTALMERRGSLALFLLSAILNPFFYPAALAAGAMRFGVRKYFFITWAGKTIKGLTVAYAGYWGLRGLLRWLGMPV